MSVCRYENLCRHQKYYWLENEPAREPQWIQASLDDDYAIRFLEHVKSKQAY